MYIYVLFMLFFLDINGIRFGFNVVVLNKV